MYFIKKVAKRTKGMGWKITKFHGIMHLAQDILNFGVPLGVDTGSNESAHKSEKKAARLTQKNKKKFDQQTQTRLNEMYLLELAELELSGLPKPWNYYDFKCIIGQEEAQITEAELNTGANLHQTLGNTTKPKPKTLGGDKFQIVLDKEHNRYSFRRVNNKKNKADSKADAKLMYESALMDFVGQLQDKFIQMEKIFSQFTQCTHERPRTQGKK